MEHIVRTRTALLLLCVVVPACKALDKSGPPAPATSSAAPPLSAPVYDVLGQAGPSRSRVRVPVQKGRATPVKQWPDPCKLLGEDDIREVLPGATKISPERGMIRTRTIDEFASDSSPHKGDNFALAGRCLYSLLLPSESQSQPRTRVWIRIEAVADPALIAAYSANYEAAGPFPANPIPGVDGCVLTGLVEGNLKCHHGPLIFEIGGYGTAHFKETEVYGIAPPFFWRDKVLPELARSVAAKIEQVK